MLEQDRGQAASPECPGAKSESEESFAYRQEGADLSLDIGAFFAVIAARFSILFTGRYPRGIFDYAEGVIRWHNRVVAYAWTPCHRPLPPFQLSP